MHLNLTRFCLLVKENKKIKKIMKKTKNKKNPIYLPTDPNFFDHVTPRILFFGPKSPLPKEYVVHI